MLQCLTHVEKTKSKWNSIWNPCQQVGPNKSSCPKLLPKKSCAKKSDVWCVSPLLSDDNCHDVGSKAGSPIADIETHRVGFTITIDLLEEFQQENSPMKPFHPLEDDCLTHVFFRMHEIPFDPHTRQVSNWNNWMFPKIGGKPPKSSIFIGISIINHPFWCITIFGNTHLYQQGLQEIMKASKKHVRPSSWPIGHLSPKKTPKTRHQMTCDALKDTDNRVSKIPQPGTPLEEPNQSEERPCSL